MDGETNIEQIIDALYEVNDERAFEVMHRIADLAIRKSLVIDGPEAAQ